MPGGGLDGPADPAAGRGPGAAFASQLAGSGIFLALLALLALTLLFIVVLPLAMAVVAGDLLAAGVALATGAALFPSCRHPDLPTRCGDSFDALLRVPVDTGTLLHGLASFGIYLLLSGAVALARLTTADITC